MSDPEKDGIDHINIYSRGQTELGRLLSHFTHAPFEVDEHGCFESVEGYWYWLISSETEREVLRDLWGYEAKKVGRKTRLPWRRSGGLEFRRRIARANREKMRQNPHIAEMLVESELPFAHYYAYDDRVVEPAGYEWLLYIFDYYRDQWQRSRT